MPSLEHYKSQMGATNRIRLVQNARPSSENVGDALTAAGEVLARVERARAESELADLDTEAKRQMDALYRSLEQDGEGAYQDFEKRLTEGSQQIRSGLTKKARSGFARKALDTRFDDIETSYIVKTRNLQARRGAEEMKASVIADVAALEDIAKDASVLFDDPKNPQARTFKSEREAVEAKINSLVRGGFIGKDGAAEMKVRLDNLSEGALSYRHQREISSRLDNGQYAQAEEYLKMHYGELTPEARDQAENAIKVKKKIGEAYSEADRIWSESNKDYGKALEQLRGIADPALRAKATELVNSMRAQDDAAKADAQGVVFEKYGDLVRRGAIRVASIPSDDLTTLTQPQINALESIEASRAKGETVETDRAVYAGFYELIAAGDYTKARQWVYDNADRVSDKDFNTLLSKAAKKDAGGTSGSIESARTLTQSVSQALRDAGVEVSDKNTGELLYAYDERFKLYQQETGKEPDDAWRDQTINDLATKIKIRRPGIFNDPNKARFKYDEIGSIPAQYTQSVLAAFPEVTEINQSDAVTYYNEAMAVFQRQGIDNPSEQGMTDMLTWLRQQAEAEASQ